MSEFFVVVAVLEISIILSIHINVDLVYKYIPNQINKQP